MPWTMQLEPMCAVSLEGKGMGRTFIGVFFLDPSLMKLGGVGLSYHCGKGRQGQALLQAPWY